MLLRLAYLGATNALAMLRLLPMSDRAKDAEILTLRHRIMVFQRQLHGQKIRFTPADRACSPHYCTTSSTSGQSSRPNRATSRAAPSVSTATRRTVSSVKASASHLARYRRGGS
ncbi:hypothetical protein [Micromonospora chersina]|uniref:hypothetical protein n=1 Tax=Micromonospora chersina TaxID=47854 RepID=UPI0033C33C2A